MRHGRSCYTMPNQYLTMNRLVYIYAYMSVIYVYISLYAYVISIYIYICVLYAGYGSAYKGEEV